MLKKLFALALLVASNFVFAGNNAVMSLLFYNYLNDPGTVFVGSDIGPDIGNEGAAVQWVTTVNGNQIPGIQVNGGSFNCYLNVGQLLILNPSKYKGDTVSVIYGQPQTSPPGISCACYGSACSGG